MSGAAIDISAMVSKRDVSNLMNDIQRASRELGKSAKESVKWAGRFVAQSLSASSKVAPKLRPVVENPDQRAATDGRRASHGVMRYDRSGNRVFRGIYRTGEYGKIRFLDKRTAQWLVRDTLTGEVTRATHPTGVDVDELQGIMQSKRRVIGRRGLAKKAWRTASMNINGGAVSVMDVPYAGSVSWTGGDNNPTVTITSNLRYAGAAFKTAGDQAVSSAMERAHARMANRIDAAVKKKMGAK
jgi:hypothetical protein